MRAPDIAPVRFARAVRRWARTQAVALPDRLRGTHVSDPALTAAVAGARSLDEALTILDGTRASLWLCDAGRSELGPALGADPLGRAQLLARADAALGHDLDLLGTGAHRFGPRIDWHTSYLGGYRWDPRKHYVELDAVPGNGADVKGPWELSRLQHLPALAVAHAITGEDRYLRGFVDDVADWIGANPPRFGINWKGPMDVALRALSIAWSWQLLRESSSVERPFRRMLYGSFLEHGRYLRTNLEWKAAGRGNHYIADLLGLVALGVLVPGFAEAAEWRAFGWQELVREAAEQVLPDGGVDEASIPYQRLTMEMLLVARLLDGRRDLDETLARMATFVRGYLKPDGHAPQIGDNDSGRALRFLLRPDLAHAYLLPLSAAIIGQPALAAGAPADAEVLCWVGPAAAAAIGRGTSSAAPSRTHAAEAFGLYTLRREDLYVAVRCGRVAEGGRSAHAHNDQLSFELHHRGDVVVDPGTRLYSSDPAIRNHFRSTQAHNTLVLDGAEQAPFDPAQIFRMPNSAAGRVVSFRADGAEGPAFTGEHAGYARLPGAPVHRRTFRLATAELVVVDELQGSGEHEVVARFHLAPGVQPQVADGSFTARGGTAAPQTSGAVELRREAGPARLTWETPVPPRVTVEPAEYSPGYGAVVPTVAVALSLKVRLPATLRFTFHLVPPPPPQSPAPRSR